MLLGGWWFKGLLEMPACMAVTDWALAALGMLSGRVRVLVEKVKGVDCFVDIMFEREYFVPPRRKLSNAGCCGWGGVDRTSTEIARRCLGGHAGGQWGGSGRRRRCCSESFWFSSNVLI